MAFRDITPAAAPTSTKSRNAEFNLTAGECHPKMPHKIVFWGLLLEIGYKIQI